MVFFFLCGLSFILHLIRKPEFSKKNIDLLLCLIPICIISCGFIHVNLPTRIFDYFAFFGLLVLQIPEKYIKKFTIFFFVFITITSFFVAKDKRVFFETSNGEIEGAAWISNNLKGKVFSDQFFVNQLILNDYYDVTGLDDFGHQTFNLFYQQNSLKLTETLKTLKIASSPS